MIARIPRQRRAGVRYGIFVDARYTIHDTRYEATIFSQTTMFSLDLVFIIIILVVIIVKRRIVYLAYY
jgi:hypothetical protein